MEQLRLNNTTITLVDHVEDRVLLYLGEHDFKLGDKLPSEHELSVSLGVTRSVVREALSRLKMLGIVESRTRRGMVLKEPSIFGGMKRAIRPNLMSEKSLVNLLGFRVSLEVGITGYIFENITPADIKDLEEAV
ncbi:MAG: GntR family transcriptional regulator, partial [Muribaculaceae bacterium]|nr:GntR family transcriptional regulator [Muribaculaceae bacterium]